MRGTASGWWLEPAQAELERGTRRWGRVGERRAMDLRELAEGYTAAWCSQVAAWVAGFYAEGGSLRINDGAAAVGREAITAAAQEFMTAFPDMVVAMDALEVEGERAVYRWTLTGRNIGPGGTGRAVRINGFEEWRVGEDGLIAESLGHFDAEEYQRQLEGKSSAVEGKLEPERLD